MSNQLPGPKTETLAAGSPSTTIRATKSTGSRTYSKIQGRKFAHLGHVLVGAWAAIAAIATATQPQLTQSLERQVQTLFFELRGPVTPPQDIVILAMDAASVAQGKLYASDPQRFSFLEPLQTSPPKRTAYAVAIDRLMSAGAQAVALDVLLDLPSAHGPEDDQPLQNVLQKYGKRVTLAALYDDTNSQTSREGDLTQLTTPNAIFQTHPISIGFINYSIAPDGRFHSFGSEYVRLLRQTYGDDRIAQALQDYAEVPSFAEATLGAAKRSYPSPKGSDIFFYGPSGTFKQVPFWQVLDPDNWKVHLRDGTFKNKIVLIGPTAEIYQDTHAAPFSKSFLYPDAMNGIEVHANAIMTLLQGRSLSEALPNPTLQGLLVLVVVAGAGLLQSRWKRPLFRLLGATGAAVLWGGVSYVLFTYGHLVLPVAVPVAAIVFTGGSYLVTGSLLEYRRKQIQRRTVERYASSPIVQEMISQMEDFEDLLQERTKAIFGKKLSGRYRIIQVLGSGGFGETYIAEDTQRPGNPRCVVKQLRPVSNNPKLLGYARQLFDREAKALEKLGRHDRIPQLLAYFEEDEEFYLVQEYIEGKPLSSELSLGKQLPESKVVTILQELLEILEFVHSQGVIHRDIKPSNIIRRLADNKLVLIDFGAVKDELIKTSDEQTSFTVGIGTQGYMPNEQCAGNPHYNSDIYAVGMTGIQALTGLPPSQLKQDPRSGEILWVYRTQGTQVSHALATILSQMVRYKFTERYRTAAEVLQVLQELTLQTAVASGQDAIPVPLPEDLVTPAFPVDLDTSAADDSDTAIAPATRPWPEAFGSSSEPSSQTFSAEPSTTPTSNP